MTINTNKSEKNLLHSKTGCERIYTGDMSWKNTKCMYENESANKAIEIVC